MGKSLKPDVRNLDDLVEELLEDCDDGSGAAMSALDPNVINLLRRGKHIQPKPTLDEIDSAYE